MSVQIRSTIDPNLAGFMRRGEGRGFVNLLRRSTRRHAGPVLDEARSLVPVKSGRLRASLGIVGLTTPSQGTVSAVIRPRDEFSFIDEHRLSRQVAKLQGPGITDRERATVARRMRKSFKALVVSRRTKDSRISAARLRGQAIDATSPFLYAYGIETGQRQDGRLARRKGGAKFLERATANGSDQFVKGVTDDALAYVTTGAGAS